MPKELIVKFVPLSGLVDAGFEPTTRTLYAVPAGVVAGMVTLKFPGVVDVDDPIVVGDAKLPAASDNCAVTTLPETKVQALTKV